ncbi:uncharacterized protein LOC111903557 [Lactuca sativa]|uniref:uncharacterized protein LOC111903557 n=1 Tax=Lactuca sativa TaxID=4236 RepID=UPI0022AFE5EA|nr:uncharacterized protein LOC111903557 [Lactuca sativa]
MEDKETASDRIQNRNIVDMLRDNKASGSKKNWKAFRDTLRLKRAGRAWTSTVPIPASDLPINTNSSTNRMMIRRGSSRYPSDPNVDELDGEATRQLGYMPDRQRSGRLLPLETDPEEESDNNPPDGGETEPEQQMSLMSLLSDHGSHYNAGPDEHSILFFFSVANGNVMRLVFLFIVRK